VLSPSEGIIENVRKLKDFSYKRIGDFESRYSKAHITIQNWYRQKPVWIEPLIPKLERDLQSLPPVDLKINGFDHFADHDRSTIYACLNPDQLTKIWFIQLRKFFGKPDFVPYITIAKSISKDAFNKLWPHFKDTDYGDQFKVDKLTILRRETIGYDKSYKVFKEIFFNPNIDFYDFTSSKLKTRVTPKNKNSSQQIFLF
jgi:2'-5' RNA ligase